MESSRPCVKLSTPHSRQMARAVAERRRVGFSRAICGGSSGGATMISRWSQGKRRRRGVGFSFSPPHAQFVATKLDSPCGTSIWPQWISIRAWNLCFLKGDLEHRLPHAAAVEHPREREEMKTKIRLPRLRLTAQQPRQGYYTNCRSKQHNIRLPRLRLTKKN